MLDIRIVINIFRVWQRSCTVFSKRSFIMRSRMTLPVMPIIFMPTVKSIFGSQQTIYMLTVSYEVPQLLVPLASVSTPTHCKWHVVNPFTESLLLRGLERFAKFAKSYPTNSKR
ncbi:hypothetical protein CsSME_00047549 [Camellia sinensis var. sinensis]